MSTVQLFKNKLRSIERNHPWVFSGAISSNVDEINNGDVVTVVDSKKNFLARGHFQHATISVRILTFEDESVDIDFFIKRLSNAYELRKKQQLFREDNNICRLVHGEGDSLPGLIIDFYNGAAVIQCHSIGMYSSVEVIADALKSVMGNELKAIYSKSSDTLKMDIENKYLLGELDTPHLALENGVKFNIDWVNGQKTGFFIDQRENRYLLAKYSAERKFLITSVIQEDSVF